jgi:hypothetical protein
LSDAAQFALTLEPIAVNREQAAQALAVSLDHFDRHIRPGLRSIKCGQRVLYPVAELRRWADAAADLAGVPRKLRSAG